MDRLIDHTKNAKQLFAFRNNISEEPVPSVTLGIVDRRRGYGLSKATSADRFDLLHLLHALRFDKSLKGTPPPFYTSICLNVNYAAALHVDKYNEGHSWLVAGGDYIGGELFYMDAGGSISCKASLEIKGLNIKQDQEVMGVLLDPKRSWIEMDGAVPHAVRDYTGYRVSIVFFSVPLCKIAPRERGILRALNFPLPPEASPFFSPSWPLPFTIFICSSGRSESIKDKTLSLLRGKVPVENIKLCVKQKDAALYSGLGLELLVTPDSAGLPEQRKMCLHGQRERSWTIFMDDDVYEILGLEEISFVHMIIYCFDICERQGVKLFGLNSSSNPMNLRSTLSRRLGLVNGYFFGIIHNSRNPSLDVSDSLNGAAEDIERSLVFFHHSGILRFNAFAAVADTWTNDGGLQGTFRSQEHRRLAHDLALEWLYARYPNSIQIDPSTKNRVRFIQAKAVNVDSDETINDMENIDESTKEDDMSEDNISSNEKELTVRFVPSRPIKQRRPRAQKRNRENHEEKKNLVNTPTIKTFQCNQCEKIYKRKEDLLHHIKVVHDSEPKRYFCATCKRGFLRRKDLVNHERGQKCHSKRGRWRAVFEETDPM